MLRQSSLRPAARIRTRQVCRTRTGRRIADKNGVPIRTPCNHFKEFRVSRKPHCIEPALPLPPENEYGCRPEVSRAVLDEFLREAGLPPSVSAQSHSALPGLVATMRAFANEECAGLAMFSVVGADLPGLLPSCMESYPVWYFVLPPELSGMAATLSRASLSVYGGLTGDPWSNAVFIGLWTDDHTVAAREGRDERLLAFPEYDANVPLAYEKGCVLVIFDCAGALHLGAIPVGEDLLLGLQACEGNSFQRPNRCYSVEYLQERTRAVEAGGEDPEGPPGNGNYVARVLQLDRGAESAGRDARRLGHPRAPLMQWRDSRPSVVGRLPHITTYLEDLDEIDARLRLKISLTPKQHEAARKGRFDARVQRVSLPYHEAKAAYVVLVRFEGELVVVALDVGHPFMVTAFEEWAGRGECPLVFENYRNGRLSSASLLWPSGYQGKLSLPEAPLLPEPGLRRKMHAEPGVRSMAEFECKPNTHDVTCYVCDAIDEIELWRVVSR